MATTPLGWEGSWPGEWCRLAEASVEGNRSAGPLGEENLAWIRLEPLAQKPWPISPDSWKTANTQLFSERSNSISCCLIPLYDLKYFPLMD